MRENFFPSFFLSFLLLLLFLFLTTILLSLPLSCRLPSSFYSLSVSLSSSDPDSGKSLMRLACVAAAAGMAVWHEQRLTSSVHFLFSSSIASVFSLLTACPPACLLVCCLSHFLHRLCVSRPRPCSPSSCCFLFPFPSPLSFFAVFGEERRKSPCNR